MIMQALNRVFFGLSAYMPLFFIFMIFGMFEPDYTFRRIVVGTFIFVIVVSAIFFILNIVDLNKRENITFMKITGRVYGSEISIVFDRTEYFIPYFSVLVLLLYRLACMTKEMDVRVMVAVFVFVAFNILLAIALILSLELYVINPMLHLCGYRFYDTDVTYHGIDSSKNNTMSIMLISKDEIEKFECIQVKNMVDRTYVSFGKSKPEES